MADTPPHHSATTLKPEAFLVYLRAKSQGIDDASLERSLPFRLPFETDRYRGSITYTERSMLATSADGIRFVVFSGVLYRPQTGDAGQTILSLYEQHGADFVRSLSGSFALVLVDQRAGEILFATDRFNLVTLLASESNGTLIVSNSMDIHPVRNLQVDAVGVACYLVSGFTYNDHTLIEGIRILEGGSVYRPRGQALEQQRYWQYLPSEVPDSPTPTADLKRELEDALLDAMRVRLRGDQPVYLSLSAGYDSRAVLGMLSERLHIPDVRTFSYTFGPPEPLTDESLAAQYAAIRGYPHRLIESFDGSYVDVLTRNGQLGGGLSDVCDEVNAWLRLGEETAGQNRPLLFTGDTTIIRSELVLRTVDDVLVAARMLDFTALHWLEPLLGVQRYRQWVDATKAETQQAVQNYPRELTGINLRDVLRFGHYDSRKVFTWREYYANRFFEVANPLLDDNVYELYMRLPMSLRYGKTLYIDTVTSMFPELFALPRSTKASYSTYALPALKRQAAEIRAWILERPSPLDDLIEPRIWLTLLESDLASYARSYTSLHSTLKKAYHLLRRVNRNVNFLARPSLVKPVIPAYSLLKRGLALRSFFQAVQERQSG